MKNTEASRLFKETAREAKRIGWGARNRAPKKRKGGCRLPSDNLTKKQIERMNGNVTTINLESIMNYEEFKGLSSDLKQLYIDNLQDKHEARGPDIAEIFGIKYNSLFTYLKSHGVKIKPIGAKTKSKYWIEFLEKNGWEKPKEEAEAVMKEEKLKEKEEPKKEEKTPKKKIDTVRLEAGMMCFEGEAYEIFARAVMALGKENRYRITIRFDAIE